MPRDDPNIPAHRNGARPRIVAEIQARMASSRLSGKTFADVAGRPMLGRVLDAARQIRLVDDVVVATTTNPRDDQTESWCQAEGVVCFRGSEDDVLARVAAAVREMRADVVVQMTGDNPLACAGVIDSQIAMFLEQGYDYVGDNIAPTYPVGCGAKIFWADMLFDLNDRCTDPFVREHVSLYFYEHPERYRIGTLAAPEGLGWPGLRVTVDTPEDLQFARAVFRALREKGCEINYRRLVAVVGEGGLDAINRHIQQKPPRYERSTET